MATLVFDTTALSVFARAGRLDVLERLTREDERVTVRAVQEELWRGVDAHPQLQEAIDAPWLRVERVDEPDELKAFAWYAARLVSGTRNVGEASVLAWAETHHAIALTDDAFAVQVARERGVEVRRTLAVIARGIRTSVLTDGDATSIVDELIGAGGRYPTAGGEFIAWARRNGLL